MERLSPFWTKIIAEMDKISQVDNFEELGQPFTPGD